MTRSFFSNRETQTFGEWWRAPTTAADRLWGLVFGGLGGVFIGLVARLLVGPMPVSFAVLAAWALGAALVFALLGVLVPKAITCVTLPFAVFFGSGGF